MPQRERLTKRNQAVRQDIAKMEEKNPQWRMDAIIKTIADKYYLSERTVNAILRCEPGYN